MTIKPQFGIDYDIGWAGFTWHAKDAVSAAIGYGERWERHGTPEVSHALIVSGDGECIEAHAKTGVARAKLSKYFDDPTCQIYFRKPAGWSPELGARVVASAATKLGCGYGTSLIFAEGVSDSLIGRWLGKLTRGWSTRTLAKLLDRQNQYICSELAAYAYEAQPEFAGKGVLANPLNCIDPQSLCDDRVIFEM